jgi:hypothetical protein
MKRMRSMSLQTVTSPRLPSGAYGVTRSTSACHGTTRSISSRKLALARSLRRQVQTQAHDTVIQLRELLRSTSGWGFGADLPWCQDPAGHELISRTDRVYQLLPF